MKALQSCVSLVLLLMLLAGQVVFAQDRPEWLETAIDVHDLDAERVAAVERVLAGSRWIGTGNPKVTKHPMTPEQCEAARESAGPGSTIPVDRLAEDARICSGPHMAPLYDPATESPADARACIDRFEFPDVPCAFPLVWTRTSEAAALCEAVGKRLCDAHEWEGACDGALEPPDYRFELVKGLDANAAVNAMRRAHNATEGQHKTWAYGEALGVSAYTKGVCAAASTKAADCNGGDYAACGSNTYPAGSFPQCVSPLGVYDLHGNAAEHMNLPLAPDQMASTGSTTLGVTEMKGSWFIFDSYIAHEDWCRWRAPYWHGSRVRDAKSHHNYHLGFRCCKTVVHETVGDKTVSHKTAGGEPPSSSP